MSFCFWRSVSRSRFIETISLTLSLQGAENSCSQNPRSLHVASGHRGLTLGEERVAIERCPERRGQVLEQFVLLFVVGGGELVGEERLGNGGANFLRSLAEGGLGVERTARPGRVDEGADRRIADCGRQLV